MPTMRSSMAMPPMTPPTIAPTLFLDEFNVCVLEDGLLFKAGEVVGEEAREATTGDTNKDDAASDDVVEDVEDFEAKDDVPDGLLLVVSPFERNTPFLLLQQEFATVPFPQQ